MTKMEGKGKEGRGHKKKRNLQQHTHREKKKHYGLLVYDLGVISSSLNRKEPCWILDELKIVNCHTGNQKLEWK